MTFRPLLIISFILLTRTISVAEEVPALLRVSSSEQPDTLGYNIVQQLSSVTYDLILNDKVKLWDSPSKDIQITASSLQEIERSSSTSFKNQEVIFIYEKWTLTKKDVQTKTIGITFSNKDSRGQEVAYGYVDFSELSPYLNKTEMAMNANGKYGETVGYYLESKKFAFNLVQFNYKVVQSVSESQSVIHSFKGRRKFSSPASVLGDEEAKLIVYRVDTKPTDDTLYTSNSARLIGMVEDYLTKNKEEFYNLGGDKLQNFVSEKQKLYVTAIEVTEMWKKNDGQIHYEPRTVQFFVNDSALNKLTISELTLMDIEQEGQKFVLMLLDKKFNYLITQINSQIIPLRDSYTYQKALQTYKWSQITEYVKYY